MAPLETSVTNGHNNYSTSTGTRSMRTLGIWTFIILVGWSSALQGPPKVTGTLGESLTVQCHYEKEYRRNNKYWCRGKWTSLCSAIVSSTRDEPSMRNGRTSITDDRANHLIRVTIGELTEDDAGDYSCAVSVTGLDPSFTVRVTVLQGTTTIKTTKGTVINSTQSFTARTAEITTSPTWRPFVQMTSVPPGPTPRATATTSATSTNSSHTGPHPAASLALILAPPVALLLLLAGLAAACSISTKRKRRKAAALSSAGGGAAGGPEVDSAGPPEVSYTTICFDGVQHPTYTNLKPRAQECLYTAVYTGQSHQPPVSIT